MYNTTIIFFINKVSGLLQGGLSRVEHNSGLVVLVGIKWHDRFCWIPDFFRPNRVTRVSMENCLHLFCVVSFMSNEWKLESLVNSLLLEFSLSWDLVYPTFTGYLYDFNPPPTPLGKKPHQYSLSLLMMPKTVRYAHSNGRTIRKLRM